VKKHIEKYKKWPKLWYFRLKYCRPFKRTISSR